MELTQGLGQGSHIPGGCWEGESDAGQIPTQRGGSKQLDSWGLEEGAAGFVATFGSLAGSKLPGRLHDAWGTGEK